MATRLSEAERRAAMAEVPDWQFVDGREAIRKVFTFRNFNEAFAFMTRAALLAEKLDHHPEWSNVYKTVDVTLATHDVGGLTALDFKLARAMDRYAAGLAA